MRTLSLVGLMLAVLFACGDDGGPSPSAHEPPQVVQPPTMVRGPMTADSAAQPVLAHVAVVNALLRERAALLGEIVAARARQGSSHGTTWTWTVVRGQSTLTVTCDLNPDGWYWTCTYAGPDTQPCTFARGYTSLDGRSGWWKFFQCTTGEVVASATWSGTQASGTSAWYTGDFQAGGQLCSEVSWETSPASTSVVVVVPQEAKAVITERADGSGDLLVFQWVDASGDWQVVFEAHWNPSGGGYYIDHRTGQTVHWGPRPRQP